MRYKARTAAVFLAVVILCTLAGCQLAREDEGTNAYEDRLVGVFLTTEYLDLFNFEGYLKENVGSFRGGEIEIDGEAEKYQGRLYATLTTKTLTNEETGKNHRNREIRISGH